MRVPSAAPVRALSFFASVAVIVAAACTSPGRGDGSGTGGLTGTGGSATGGNAGRRWRAAADPAARARAARPAPAQGPAAPSVARRIGDDRHRRRGGQWRQRDRQRRQCVRRRGRVGRNQRRHRWRDRGHGSGGAGGTAGTTPAVVIPGAGNCMPPSGANVADARAAYAKWKTDLLTSDGAGGFLRVRRPNSSSAEVNSTVSEGIAYGMLLSVYADDQPTFDKLWQYSQKWLDGNGLMNWYINAAGTQALGTGAASDADEDMAYALIVADARWGGKGSLTTNYIDLAKTLIGKIWQYEVDHTRSDVLKPGDTGSTGRSSTSRTSRPPTTACSAASPARPPNWNNVATDELRRHRDDAERAERQREQRPRPRLVDARRRADGASRHQHPTHHQLDSCRTPFRAGGRLLLERRAARADLPAEDQRLLRRRRRGHIVDGYDLNGTPHPQFVTTGGPRAASFIGAAGVGAMATGATYAHAAQRRLRERRDADAARGQHLLPGIVDRADAADDDRPVPAFRINGPRTRPPSLRLLWRNVNNPLLRRLRLALVLAATGAGCVAPPAPRIIPGSGVPGQRRTSMTSARAKGDNPFHDVYFAVARGSYAELAAEQWRTSRPADAAAMDKIARQPVASWMGNWNPNIEVDVEDARPVSDPRRRLAGDDPLQPSVPRLRPLLRGRRRLGRPLPQVDRRRRARHRVAARGVRAGAGRPAPDVRLPEREEAPGTDRDDPLRRRHADRAARRRGVHRRRPLELDAGRRDRAAACWPRASTRPTGSR